MPNPLCKGLLDLMHPPAEVKAVPMPGAES